MGRIQKFYEHRFRAFAGHDEAKMRELYHRATCLAAQLVGLNRDAAEPARSSQNVPSQWQAASAASDPNHSPRFESLALALIHAELRRATGQTTHYPHDFVCDAGVGGLARWLRGAGYEAYWNPALDDAAVIREARQRAATLITADSLMMERGVLRDGLVPSVFVPSSITCEDQLLVVLDELALPLRDSRCMKCGGELVSVDKRAVADRIPPKTALWIDDYFLCARCNQLFWRGTHWRRITEKLRHLRSPALQ